MNEFEEMNPLKNCLTIQVSDEEVNSPDFNLSNYLNKKIKKTWFKKALKYEHTSSLDIPKRVE